MLNPDILYEAYCSGAFPMADSGGRIEWYMVRQRALFPLSGIRVSRSLARTLRRGKFLVTFDTAFEDVMLGCFRPGDNWLTEEFVAAYTDCHSEGWGHSCEVWVDDRLVGGVYGLAIGGCFSAESMFHRERDMSKVALWALINKCRDLGFVLFDAQVMNPHLASLGAFEINHKLFARQLKAARTISTAWGRQL
ncbi:MAG: leucyl/phenylalanyl-tRNA--protein transferase [Chthonomonadaceae bacterium]|nr:leucyl/phenylalanyl-tRNA--protein transferase [Chthonomonadaceae bacterium]